MTVSSALSSRPVSHFKTDDREVDLVMQYREEDRERSTSSRTLPVAAAAGRQPIGALADFSIESGPQTIERENRRPELDVTANTTRPAANFRMMGEVQAILDSLRLPPGYEWSFGRWTRNAAQDLAGSRFASCSPRPRLHDHGRAVRELRPAAHDHVLGAVRLPRRAAS